MKIILVKIINNNDYDKKASRIKRWSIKLVKIINNNDYDKKASRIRKMKDNTSQNY